MATKYVKCNPERAAKVEFRLLASIEVILLGLSITTISTSVFFVFQGLDNLWLSIPACIAAAMVSYKAVDALIPDFLTLSTSLLFGKEEEGSKLSKAEPKFRRAVYAMVLGGAFLFLGLSGGFTYITGSVAALVSTGANEGGETGEIKSFVETETATLNNSLADLDEEIDFARANQRSDVRAAKRTGHEKVYAAIHEGSDYWIKTNRGRGEYSRKRAETYVRSARSQLSRKKILPNSAFAQWMYKVEQAKKDSASLVASAESRLSTLIATRDGKAQAGTAAIDSTRNSLIALRKQELALKNEFVNTVKYSLIVADISLVFIAAFLNVLLGIWCNVWDQEYDHNPGGLMEAVYDMLVGIFSNLFNWMDLGIGSAFNMGNFIKKKALAVVDKTEEDISITKNAADIKKADIPEEDNTSKPKASSSGSSSGSTDGDTIVIQATRKPKPVPVDFGRERNSAATAFARAAKSGDEEKLAIVRKKLEKLRQVGYIVTEDLPNCKVSIKQGPEMKIAKKKLRVA